ncbi:hypothetical protein ACFFYR_23620 [Paraburkholderia dipogonis]
MNGLAWMTLILAAMIGASSRRSARIVLALTSVSGRLTRHDDHHRDY